MSTSKGVAAVRHTPSPRISNPAAQLRADAREQWTRESKIRGWLFRHFARHGDLPATPQDGRADGVRSPDAVLSLLGGPWASAMERFARRYALDSLRFAPMPQPPILPPPADSWPDWQTRCLAMAEEHLRYGLSRSVLGRRYGISRERARQLLNKAGLTTAESTWAMRAHSLVRWSCDECGVLQIRRPGRCYARYCGRTCAAASGAADGQIWDDAALTRALLEFAAEHGDLPAWSEVLADPRFPPARPTWAGFRRGRLWVVCMHEFALAHGIETARFADTIGADYNYRRIWSRQSVEEALLAWAHRHGDLPSQPDIREADGLPGRDAIRSHLGGASWGEDMRALAQRHGIESRRYPPRPRRQGEVLVDPSLAESWQRNRSAGSSPTGRWGVFRPIPSARVAELFHEGLSPIQIADRLHHTRPAVRRALSRAGISADEQAEAERRRHVERVQANREASCPVLTCRRCGKQQPRLAHMLERKYCNRTCASQSQRLPVHEALNLLWAYREQHGCLPTWTACRQDDDLPWGNTILGCFDASRWACAMALAARLLGEPDPRYGRLDEDHLGPRGRALLAMVRFVDQNHRLPESAEIAASPTLGPVASLGSYAAIDWALIFPHLADDRGPG